jgi:transposase
MVVANRARRHRTGAEKTELVLLALAGQSTGDLAREHEVNPTLLCRWRADFVAAGFQRLASSAEREDAENGLIEQLRIEVAELQGALGRKTIELDRLQNPGEWL